MRGVGALSLALPEPAAFFEQGEHGIQQQVFGSPVYQTLTKARQDRKIKAGISQLQAKGILQINTTTNGLCGLSIGQPFDELHNRDQRQSLWGLDRTSIMGK